MKVTIIPDYAIIFLIPKETRMSKKTISLVLLIIGAVLLVLSLFADLIGIGSYPGMHSSQIAGIIMSAILLALGLFFRFTKAALKK